ncbi:hypothetical protein HG530_004253 [Fusarium avenaceum]|nr:hypothetical protein HG530_004253 [Fusarium avenaceum]
MNVQDKLHELGDTVDAKRLCQSQTNDDGGENLLSGGTSTTHVHLRVLFHHTEPVVVIALACVRLVVRADEDCVDVCSLVGALPQFASNAIDLRHLHRVKLHDSFINSRATLSQILNSSFGCFHANLSFEGIEFRLGALALFAERRQFGSQSLIRFIGWPHGSQFLQACDRLLEILLGIDFTFGIKVLFNSLAQAFHACSLIFVKVTVAEQTFSLGIKEALAFGVIVHKGVKKTEVISELLDLRFGGFNFLLVVFDERIIADCEKGINHSLLTSSCFLAFLILRFPSSSQPKFNFLLLDACLVATSLGLGDDLVLHLVKLWLPSTRQSIKFTLAISKFLLPVVELGPLRRQTSALDKLPTQFVILALKLVQLVVLIGELAIPICVLKGLLSGLEPAFKILHLPIKYSLRAFVHVYLTCLVLKNRSALLDGTHPLFSGHAILSARGLATFKLGNDTSGPI